MPRFSSLDDAAARLRELLTCSSDAITSTLQSWGAAGLHVEEVVHRDVANGASPSLLLLAAAARATETVTALLRDGADAGPGEDVYAVLVEAFDASDAAGSNVDLSMHGTLLYILQHGINVPPSAGPSRATVTCSERRWQLCLNVMIRIDPWAMHYLQSLPSSIAAGDKATEDATALVAGVVTGDAAATRQAVKQLFDTMKGQHEWNCFQRAAARAAMHAMVHVHLVAGTLRALAAHADAENLQWIARQTGDVDAVLALAEAGSRPIDATSMDVYCAIIAFRTVWDASGAPVSDERLAVSFQHLYATGVVPQCGQAAPLTATSFCAIEGRLHCLRVMVEVVDPHPRMAGDLSRTALHDAAEVCRVDCITYLIQAGWDVHARDADGCTPLDLCIMNTCRTPHACVAGITAMTAGMGDVRPLIRSSVLVAQHARAAARPLREVARPFLRQHIARILLHMLAAVRSTPAAPSITLKAPYNFGQLLNLHMYLLRSEALDVHSVHGVYIPDQLRAGQDAAAAAQLAVHVDTMLDMQPYAERNREGSAYYDADRRYKVLRVWREYVRPAVLLGRSCTLMSWAFMRRLHALKHRRDVVCRPGPTLLHL